MTPEDIQAASDVLADVDEITDSLGIEEAVAYRVRVNELFTQVKQTLGLIDTQLIAVLESPREINGNLYEVRKSDGAWRPDHTLVDRIVKKQSLVNTDTGEMLSANGAAEKAMMLMAELYRAPSTMPKIGVLKKLGAAKWDVAEQEPGKAYLKVTAVAEDPRDSSST
jgi:hypothetical protein